MAVTTITLTGDIYATRRLSPVASRSEPVFEILRSSDVSVGNFEIPLSDRGSPIEKLLNIRAAPAIAKDLPILGLDVVTVANNHAVDYGWEGLEQTVELLRESDILVVGAGASISEALRPELIDRAGKRIGIIGFSCLLPTGMAASASRPGIAPIHIDTAYEIDSYYQMEEPGDISVVKVRTSTRSIDLERALNEIRSLRSKCDVVLVTLHWGFGSGEKLAEYQMPLARSLIEAGADIVHGHHPHAVHGVGFYRGKPILFSMNVLIGQQVFLEASPQVKALWADMSGDGFVSRVIVSENGAMEVEAIPTVLDENRLPILAEGTDFERIYDRLARLSYELGAVVEKDGSTLRLREMAP
jgi:poly-gamma-glutamate synthesis protein (capsule biosynthesis protein)